MNKTQYIKQVCDELAADDPNLVISINHIGADHSVDISHKSLPKECCYRVEGNREQEWFKEQITIGVKNIWVQLLSIPTGAV